MFEEIINKIISTGTTIVLSVFAVIGIQATTMPEIPMFSPEPVAETTPLPTAITTTTVDPTPTSTAVVSAKPSITGTTITTNEEEKARYCEERKAEINAIYESLLKSMLSLSPEQTEQKEIINETREKSRSLDCSDPLTKDECLAKKNEYAIIITTAENTLNQMTKDRNPNGGDPIERLVSEKDKALAKVNELYCN